MKKFLLAAAALSMTASPVLAANATPAPAANASRANAPAGESNLYGQGGYIVPVIAVLVIIAGVLIIARNKDKPNSP